KDAKTSLVATASAVVPKALDTQHLRQDVDEIAQSAKPPTPTDGHGGASTAAPTDSTNTYDDPDATRGQTGNWFAEGELAEKALVTATASQPLPAIYGSFDELDLEPRRRFSATTAIVVVVGLAVVIFGMIFMLHGSKEPTKKRRGGGELPLLVKGHRAPKIDQGTPNADMGTGTQSVAQAGSVTPAGSVAPAGSGTGSHTPETPGTSTGTKPSPQAPPVATPPPADTKPQQASLTPDKTTKTPPRSIPKKAHPQPIVHRTPPPAPKPVTPRKPRPKPLPVPRPAVAAAPKAVVRGYIREGRSQLQKGGYGKAKAAFLKALAANPRSANAQGGLGEVAFELGNYALASKHLRAAVRLNPRSGRYLVMLGNVYFKQGKIGAAVKQYRQALKFNPHNRAARTGIEAAIRRSGHGA
ncbi:MAG: tetratricopeptide repeat protein, partial [Deltaproteobacteria bacterium]|nr:tetratricopeptide repeat protein [Deltaproteobacteria bacterium]